MISLQQKIEIIKNTGIFGTIASQYHEAIAERMGEKVFKADEILFREGDPGNELLIVCSGQIEIIKGKTHRLALLEEGDVLGEMAPLSGEIRSTSARAKSKVRVLFLKGYALKLLIHKFPELSLALIQLLIKRLKVANEIIHDTIQPQTNKTSYFLYVEEGAQRGEKIPLYQYMILGRGIPEEKSPVRFNFKGSLKSRISRRHVEIFHRHGNYFIKDLGSRNGTLVNGTRLQEIVSLCPDDIIKIGEVIVSFNEE